jgi:hypothetical protein
MSFCFIGRHGYAVILMRKTTLQLLPCALLCSAALWAQTDDTAGDSRRNDAPNDGVDEITVRGQRLEDVRAALQSARVHVYDVFNKLNSDDAFDVHCKVEGSTGRRTRRQICRPQFQDDISAAAAKAWSSALKDACGLSQECIFSGAAGKAKSRAVAEEAKEPIMRERFALEMAHVVAENPEMQQAILDYQAIERAHDKVRGRRRERGCDRPEPPSRCLR